MNILQGTSFGNFMKKNSNFSYIINPQKDDKPSLLTD